ncbi:MAG TPA: SUMF1/EgtB/PvdO family nonheme iron enzyme, partial [Chloroflexota bacterium]|nr:SUMF1/EgtB/PvdO family nonheme iron enzyme [Chloroflexota bacterium]
MTTIQWVQIPDGTVTLAAGGYLPQVAAFDLPAFTISRYPVTNAQFGEFVAAGGYGRGDWWDEAGWTARQKWQWTAPRYWDNRDWTQPDQPVIGISWFEAMA